MLRSLALLLCGLLAGIAGVFVWQCLDFQPPDGKGGGSSQANSGGNSFPRQTIRALGTLEPSGGMVQIASPLIGYQIKRIAAREGSFVKEGELLVELDAAPAEAEFQLAVSQQTEAEQRQRSEVALAKERVASAQLAVQQAAEGRPIELDAQRAKISLAAIRKTQAEKDLERVTALRKLPEPLSSDQQVEQQRLLMDTAEAEHTAMKAAYGRLEQALLFQEQTAAADLRTARQGLAVAEQGAGVDSLKRRVELAQIKVKQTRITAPAAGVVLDILAHAGEVIQSQPLLQMADLETLVCVAEVDAADLPWLDYHQKVDIRCRAFHERPLEGVIDRTGSVVAQASLRWSDPRRPIDRTVAKVVVRVDAAQAKQLMKIADEDRRGAFVGLQMELEFPISSAAKTAAASGAHAQSR